VPDVTQQAQALAETILTQAHLTPALIFQPVNDPSQDGIVLSQDPAGGTAARTNEVVTITVGQLQNGVPGGDGSTTTNTTPPTPTPTPP
jgi:beta-lactam-binding protein with PASTA domain